MYLEFWGVRGSIPTTGADKVRTGGNTSCISIYVQKKLFVFDAGTGIKSISEKHSDVSQIYLSITHPHWDHIQGLPFFDFIYNPSKKIHFIDYAGSSANERAMDQMDGECFPVVFSKVKSKVCKLNADRLHEVFDHQIQISSIEVKHGIFCLGFRVDLGDIRVTYIPDNELSLYSDAEMNKLVKFCSESDYLIHDSQYTEDELIDKSGWGHSSWRQSCNLAIESKSKNVVLFHHDPSRNDNEIEKFEQMSRDYLKENGSYITVLAAREGQKIYLDQ
jgi:phosphoribosyl 1,2-cyclic phosphodiesterase